jgi:hypothetical protein
MRYANLDGRSRGASLARILRWKLGLHEEMHWGTFKLTDEDLREPPGLLRHIWARENLPDAPLAIPAIGETLLLDRGGA